MDFTLLDLFLGGGMPPNSKQYTETPEKLREGIRKKTRKKIQKTILPMLARPQTSLRANQTISKLGRLMVLCSLHSMVPDLLTTLTKDHTGIDLY